MRGLVRNNQGGKRQRGERLFSDSGATVGAYLAPGSGSWTSMSNQNLKENHPAAQPPAVVAGNKVALGLGTSLGPSCFPRDRSDRARHALNHEIIMKTKEPAAITVTDGGSGYQAGTEPFLDSDTLLEWYEPVGEMTSRFYRLGVTRD